MAKDWEWSPSRPRTRTIAEQLLEEREARVTVRAAEMDAKKNESKFKLGEVYSFLGNNATVVYVYSSQITLAYWDLHKQFHTFIVTSDQYVLLKPEIKYGE